MNIDRVCLFIRGNGFIEVDIIFSLENRVVRKLVLLLEENSKIKIILVYVNFLNGYYFK